MPFGIPSIEKKAEQSNKKNVVTNILTVEGLRGSTVLERTADVFGETILNDLPENVRDFTYSEKLPKITAHRESGTDSWNAAIALDWALTGQPGHVKERMLASVGEIL